MAKTITVRRKGYKRKGYTTARRGKKVRISSAKIKPSTFKIRDRGKIGRGPKIVPPLDKGALGGPGFFKRPEDQQERIVFERARELGEKKVVGQLRALQVFFKTTDPKISKRALELSKRIAGSFRGKKEVKYPEGYAKRPKD